MKRGSKLTDEQKNNIRKGLKKKYYSDPVYRQKIKDIMKKAHADGKFGDRRVFMENSTCKPETIKRYLIEERGHKCEKCNLTDWLLQLIPLNIHHNNAIKNDNRKENLRLLCANCHSLTDTFCYKAKKFKDIRLNGGLTESSNVSVC